MIKHAEEIFYAKIIRMPQAFKTGQEVHFRNVPDVTFTIVEVNGDKLLCKDRNKVLHTFYASLMVVANALPPKPQLRIV